MVQETKLYSPLSIRPDATQDEIRTAFRKAALKQHPDKNIGNPEAVNNFQEVLQAYEILSDPKKRRTYDQYGLQFLLQGGAQSPMSSPGRDGFGGFGGMPGRREIAATADIPNDRKWELHLRAYTITTDKPPCFYYTDRKIQPDSNTLQLHIAAEHTGIEVTWATFSYIFCKATFTQEDPYTCADQYLTHIFNHFLNGCKIEQSKPSFIVQRYMHEENLLSDEDFAHFIKYTERPYVEGLREHDCVPEKIQKETEKIRRSNNEFVVNNRQEKKEIATRRRRRQREVPAVVINPT